MFSKTTVTTGLNWSKLQQEKACDQPQQSWQQQQQTLQNDPENLFTVLPFHLDPPEDVRLHPYATLSFIPGISHALKRAFAKAGCNLYNKSGNKLQNILCGKNKTQPPPCKCKGIYKFHCSCSPNAIYVGITRRSIDIRAAKHKRAVDTGKWSLSGLAQHRQECHAPIDWTPEVLSCVNTKGMKPQQLSHHLKVEEALWIRRLNCGPGRGLNEDYGSYVRTDAWKPILKELWTRSVRRGGMRDLSLFGLIVFFLLSSSPFSSPNLFPFLPIIPLMMTCQFELQFL